MELYQLNQQSEEIANQIKLSKAKLTYRQPTAFAIQSDYDWNASFFFAMLLFESQIKPNTFLTERDLSELHESFEKKDGTLDIEVLKNRFWIRNVLGIIEIPSLISNAVRHFEKIEEAEAEFNFLRDAIKNFKKGNDIGLQEFMLFFEKYQQEKSLRISIDLCKIAFHLKLENDKVTINNIRYNEPLFVHKRELKFIETVLEKQKEGDRHCLQIDSNRLQSIHKNHKSVFSKTPPIDDLIAEGVIKKEDKHYTLKIGHSNLQYGETLYNKISPQLFALMRGSEDYREDAELLKEWLLKLSFVADFNHSSEGFNAEDTSLILETSLTILLNEKEVAGADTEIDKLVLSGRHSGYSINQGSIKKHFPDLTKSKNVFELFQQLQECNETGQNDMLWIQETRWLIADLTSLIVFFDNGKGEDGLSYPHIRKLILAGKDSPYLLWKTCFYIYYWKPELIPYLIVDPSICSLAFKLYFISSVDDGYPKEHAAILKNGIACKCFGLLLSSLYSNRQIQPAERAVPIFECLKLLLESKQEININRRSNSLNEEISFLSKLYIDLASVLKGQKLQEPVFGGTFESRKHLYEETLEGLYQQIKDYDGQAIYRASVIGVPFVKLQLYGLVLGLIQLCTSQKKAGDAPTLNAGSLAQKFLSEYTKAFNCSTVKTWDYFESMNKETVPIWSSQYKAEAVSIKWHDWALLLEEHELLEQFLQPLDLKLQPSGDTFDKYNYYTVEKIRTHLEILLSIHEHLKNSETAYKQKGKKVGSALYKLELSISRFIVKYSVTDTQNARIDIFSDRNENAISGVHGNELLPKLAQAINKFSSENKTTILTALTQSDPITKCLKLLEFLSNESDRDFIKKQMTGLDVASYLDEKNYIPEIETVVTKLAEFEEFTEKAKEALEYWKNRILTRRDNKEYQITYFRLKLLIAYYAVDEQTIVQEKSPTSERFHGSNGHVFRSEETRSFYLGLVKLKKDMPEEAYKIFNELMRSTESEKSSIAVNRFYSHIAFAEANQDRREKEKMLAEALAEWELYEQGLPEKDRDAVLSFSKENVWLNKLAVYHKLRRDSDFDTLYTSLEKHFQLRKDFFECRISNLIERAYYEQAKAVLKEAKDYHQSEDGVLPEFIKEARERLENEDDFVRLRKEFQDMVSRTPEKLVQILPENLIGKRKLPDYVLKEICGSANDILDYINSIEEIGLEDKYTDLLLLSLQARLRNWHWHVGNTRGGFAATNKRNNGELDFIIKGADQERIATCEALLLHGKNTSTVTTHSIKTFNYDHRRKLFFVLAYYSGSDFPSHWKDYKTNILPNIEYPEGFPISGAIEEIDEPYTNASIKAALVNHGDDTRVYHVFININYKL